MAESEDLREFIREMFLRQDRTWRDQWQVLQDQVDEIRALRLRNDAAWEENRLEHEAQRNALLHVLDRLQNGGAQA